MDTSSVDMKSMQRMWVKVVLLLAVNSSLCGYRFFWKKCWMNYVQNENHHEIFRDAESGRLSISAHQILVDTFYFCCSTIEGCADYSVSQSFRDIKSWCFMLAYLILQAYSNRKCFLSESSSSFKYFSFLHIGHISFLSFQHQQSTVDWVGSKWSMEGFYPQMILRQTKNAFECRSLSQSSARQLSVHHVFRLCDRAPSI